MIPVEFFWFALIFAFGMMGVLRGLSKELGATAILMVSLFALYEGWNLVLGNFFPPPEGKGATGTGSVVEAAYYGFSILLIGFISYEGVSLRFPVREAGGLLKWILGFSGGLINGYLIVGTVWNAVVWLDYFQGKLGIVQCCLTTLHQTLVNYLPVNLMEQTSPFIFFVPGLFLLLLIVLK